MYQIIASILIMICLTMMRLVAMLLGEHGVDYVCFRASKARKLVEPYLGDRVPFTYCKDHRSLSTEYDVYL